MLIRIQVFQVVNTVSL